MAFLVAVADFLLHLFAAGIPIEEQRELVAGEAYRNGALPSGHGAQQIRHGLQIPVPRAVPVGVVDVFQIVQIAEDQAVDPQRILIQKLLPLHPQVSRIVQSGELIVLGQIPQPDDLHVGVGLIHHHAEHAVLLLLLPDGHGPQVVPGVLKPEAVLQLVDFIHPRQKADPILVGDNVGPVCVFLRYIQQAFQGAGELYPAPRALVLKAAHHLPGGLHCQGIPGMALLQSARHVVQRQVDVVDLGQAALFEVNALRILPRDILPELAQRTHELVNHNIGKYNGNQHRDTVDRHDHHHRVLGQRRKLRLVRHLGDVHRAALHVAVEL